MSETSFTNMNPPIFPHLVLHLDRMTHEELAELAGLVKAMSAFGAEAPSTKVQGPNAGGAL
jgi:hypothetical protein